MSSPTTEGPLMSHRPSNSEEHYAAIVKTLLKNPDITRSQEKGFGSTALWTNGKICVLLSSKGEFIVKLPRERVDTLIASGQGKRWDPGHGRIMKEWLAVEPTSSEKWLPLAREAMKYVASKR